MFLTGSRMGGRMLPVGRIGHHSEGIIIHIAKGGTNAMSHFSLMS